MPRERARSIGAKVERRVHNDQPRNESSIDERKKNIQTGKSHSNCCACGHNGHWAGENDCPPKSGGSGNTGAHGLGKGNGKEECRPYRGPPKSRVRTAAILSQSSDGAPAMCLHGKVGDLAACRGLDAKTSTPDEEESLLGSHAGPL